MERTSSQRTSTTLSETDFRLRGEDASRVLQRTSMATSMFHLCSSIPKIIFSSGHGGEVRWGSAFASVYDVIDIPLGGVYNIRLGTALRVRSKICIYLYKQLRQFVVTDAGILLV